MTKKSSLMSKVMVLMLALAVMFTYSVMPMNQAYAASAKKPAKVVIKTVKAVSSSSVKVTWKKAKRAKKYEVYVSTNAKKGFKKVATTKKTSYKVTKYNKKKLKANKKYYVKVRAVNGKKKGKFSKVKSVKTKKTTTKKTTDTDTTPEDQETLKSASETKAVLGDAKTMTLTTEIDMSAYEAGKAVKVWVPVPQTDEKDGYQTVTDVVFDAPKAKEAKITTEKINGNQMLYLEWDSATDPADRTATMSFTATRYDVSRSNLKDAKNVDLSTEAKAYVSKESEYVKVNDPIVKKYAEEAVKNVKDKDSVVEKARAIYDWEIANLARIDNGEKLGDYTFAVEGCGYGDTVKILSDFDKYGIAGGHCTDLNSTFVALCRANGIAAREMFGIRLGKDGENVTGYQHCWAEFYLPGTGWVFADPADVLKAVKPAVPEDKQIDLDAWKTAKASDTFKEKAEFFWGHVDNNRVVLSRGRDITFEPAQAWGTCNTFGYPAAEVGGERMPADFTKGSEFVYTITSSKPSKSVYDMTADEWADEGISVDKLDLNNDFILNVRAAAAYETMHIAGAVNVPVGREPAATGSDEAKALDKAFEDAAGKRIVIVCNSGQGLAKSAMEYYRTSGKDMTNVTYLIGGATKYPEINPDKMEIGASHYITAETLINDIKSGNPEYSVVDVRLDKDNTGSLGTFDDSHLVTAVSAPVHDADNKALSTDEIAENLSKAGVSKDGDQKYAIVCYYGGELAKRGFINAVSAMGVSADRLFIVEGGMWAMDPDWSFMTDHPYEASEYFVSTGTSKAGISYNGVKPDQLKNDINGTHKIYKVVDVRKADDYEANHIPTAESAPVNTGDDSVDAANIKALYDKYGNGAVYCLVCYSGNAYADKGQSVLMDLGVPAGNIVRLIGGDGAWSY